MPNISALSCMRYRVEGLDRILDSDMRLDLVIPNSYSIPIPKLIPRFPALRDCTIAVVDSIIAVVASV